MHQSSFFTCDIDSWSLRIYLYLIPTDSNRYSEKCLVNYLCRSLFKNGLQRQSETQVKYQSQTDHGAGDSFCASQVTYYYLFDEDWPIFRKKIRIKKCTMQNVTSQRICKGISLSFTGVNVKDVCTGCSNWTRRRPRENKHKLTLALKIMDR